MGKINMQKLLIGGLIAGVVLNVVDSVLFGMVLKDQMPPRRHRSTDPP